jgi:hypothetical protein
MAWTIFRQKNCQLNSLLLFRVSQHGRWLGAAEVIELTIEDCWSPHQVL